MDINCDYDTVCVCYEEAYITEAAAMLVGAVLLHSLIRNRLPSSYYHQTAGRGALSYTVNQLPHIYIA